jgi:hypothetical protein
MAAPQEAVEPWEPKGARFYMPRIGLGNELLEVTARRINDFERIAVEIPLDNAPDLTITGTPAQLVTLAASMMAAVQQLVPDVEVTLVPLDQDQAP